MNDTNTIVRDEMLQEVQAITAVAFSGLLRKWKSMYEVTEDFLVRREKKVLEYIQGLFNELEEGEETKRIQMIDQIDNKMEEFHKLKKDLQMDGESLPWKEEREPYTLFLQEIDNEMKKYVDIKKSRLEKLASLRAKEKELCDLLEIDMLPEFTNAIPTDGQLDDIEMHIFQLREEKFSRIDFFKEAKSRIIELMKFIDYDVELDFEIEMLSSNEETFIPSTSRINKLKELQSSMEREYEQKLAYRDSLMDKLSKLWDQIKVEQPERNTFRTRYTRVSKTHLQAINEEIARCEKIKLANIKPIIESLREQIVNMWDQLKYSQEQRSAFAALYTDHFSEDVLDLHELELNNLEHFFQKHQHIYQLAEKREELWKRMLHLDEMANDKSRLFTNRGGQLLKEEKERKKLEVNLPKVDSQLREALFEFQREEGQPFLWYGSDLLEKVNLEWEERLAAKESKKLSRKVESRCDTRRPIEKRKLGTPISSARDAKTRRQDDLGSQTIILKGGGVRTPGKLPCIQTPLNISTASLASYSNFQDGLEKSEMSVATPRSALKEVGNRVPGIGHSSPTLLTPAGRKGTPAFAFGRCTPRSRAATPATSRKGTPSSAIRSGGRNTSAVPRITAHKTRLHLEF